LLELAQPFDGYANRTTQWKSRLLEGAAAVFGGEAKSQPAEAVVGLNSLHAEIGQLALENVSWKRRSPSRDCRAQGDDRPRTQAARQASSRGVGNHGNLSNQTEPRLWLAD